MRGVDDRYWSVAEVSGYLGVKRDTVYKWITRRGLPAHKVGRLWKFRKQEIDDWVPPADSATPSAENGTRAQGNKRSRV